MSGNNGPKPPSRREATRRSEMLAGSTRHAIGRPNVSTRMWRLRPFTRLCASKPRTPPRSVVFTDCLSMITRDTRTGRLSCELPHRFLVAGESIHRSSSTCGNSEIVVHGAPGWKLPRKKTPLTAGAKQIESRVLITARIRRLPGRAAGKSGRAVPTLRRSRPWHSDCLALSSFTERRQYLQSGVILLKRIRQSKPTVD